MPLGAAVVLLAALPSLGLETDAAPDLSAHALSTLEPHERRHEVAWRRTPPSHTLDEVLADPFPAPETVSVLNLGRQQDAVWVHLWFVNDTPRALERVFLVEWPRLADVRAWAIGADGAPRALGRSGWGVPWDRRPLPGTGHRFPIRFEPGERQDLYLRVETPTELILFFKLVDWEGMLTHDRSGGVFTGLYIGVVLGLAVYNVLVAFRVRRRYHFLYAASVFCFIPWWLMNAGWLSWIPNLGPYLRPATVVFLTGWHFFRLELTRDFLRLGQVAPRLNRLLKWTGRLVLPAGSALIFLALSPVDQERLGASFDAPLVGLTVIAGVVAWRGGLRIARWFVPATSLLLLGLLLGQAIFTGVLLHPALAGASILLGTLGELLVLSLALAERSREDEASRQLVLREATSHRLSSLESLVAGVTHELNTPLGTLRSSADSLARVGTQLRANLPDPVPDEARRSARVLPALVTSTQQAAFRIEAIVKALRTFARLDEADEEPVDITVGIRSALVLLEARVPPGVVLKVDLPPMPALPCRPAEINQAFMAVATNALEAMPNGGTLTVRAYETPTSVEIAVEDDGVGIPPGLRAHLFEPRLVRRGARVRMGMGLSIVRSILERHGGRVFVDSDTGTGTRVRMSFPRRPGTAQVRGGSTRSSASSSRSTSSARL